MAAFSGRQSTESARERDSNSDRKAAFTVGRDGAEMSGVRSDGAVGDGGTMYGPGRDGARSRERRSMVPEETVQVPGDAA